MPHANTLEEYLELRSQGLKQVTIDSSNKELMDFVLEEMRLGDEGIMRKYGISTKDKRYFSTLNSKLSFGRYKDNELKCVYKCDPYYLEWCMINADSFCIDEETVEIMRSVKVWISNDLEFKEESTAFVLDLRDFKKDKYGFPCSHNVEEIYFSFLSAALDENKSKLSKELNPYNVVRGGNWNKMNVIRHPVKHPTKKMRIIF